jgi:cyclase
MEWKMLKKRILPVQLLINNRLVKTVHFDSYRDAGDPISSSKIYSQQDTDELVFLNIDREKRNVSELIPLIKKVSEVCFMPLSVGGGIKCLNDVEQLIENGADKVVINSICYTNPELIREIVRKFGSQAVIISIDVKYDFAEKKYNLYSECGKKQENISLKNHIMSLGRYKPGEIFVNSIDRDGTMIGYDINLIKKVMKYTSVPVIACGGSGNFEHLKEAFIKTGVSALGCGSIFIFGDNNPIRAKAYLSNYNISFKVI